MKHIWLSNLRKGLLSYFISSFFALMFLLIGGCTSKSNIHTLAKWGKIDELSSVLTRKPQAVNLETSSGLTPLHIAALWGRLETVKLLISNGANINAYDNKSETPLHKATLGARPEVAQLLIENGATVNPENKWGRTPLALVMECQLKKGMTRKEVNGCLNGIYLSAPKLLSPHGKSAVFQDTKGRISFYGHGDYRGDPKAIATDECPYSNDFDTVVFANGWKFRFHRIESRCVLVEWSELFLEKREAAAEVLRKHGGK